MNRVNAFLIAAAVAHLDRTRVEIPAGDPIPEDLMTKVYKKLTTIGVDKINNDYSVDEINALSDEIHKEFQVNGEYPRVTEFSKLLEIDADGVKDLAFHNTFDLMGDGAHELNVIIGQNDPKGPVDFRIEAILLENPGTDHESVVAHHLTRFDGARGQVVYTVWPELPAHEEGQPEPELRKKARMIGQLAASMLKPLILDCGNLLSEIDTNTAAVAYAARDSMMKL